jgi:integrase/recombinase XerD
MREHLVRSKGPARALTSDEITRLTALAGPRDRALIWCCLGAGLRAGEATTLQVGHIGSDGSVLVEAQHAKSGKSRRVFLSDEALVHLRAWTDLHPLRHDFRAPLFPSRKGGAPIKSGSQLVEQLMLRAGVLGASSHSLRRTHATGLRDQGADLLVVRAQLGHSSIAVTERYLQFFPAEQRESVRKLKLGA